VVFVAFMIIMTIIISNMLVGLAVDDIKSVQDNAILRRQALKVQLALEWEYKGKFRQNARSVQNYQIPFLPKTAKF